MSAGSVVLNVSERVCVRICRGELRVIGGADCGVWSASHDLCWLLSNPAPVSAGPLGPDIDPSRHVHTLGTDCAENRNEDRIRNVPNKPVERGQNSWQQAQHVKL